jgi:hypothetical protein
MGTPLWADRARAELARAEVVPTHDLPLTPSELRVAELAASGMTNRDVAAALTRCPPINPPAPMTRMLFCSLDIYIPPHACRTDTYPIIAICAVPIMVFAISASIANIPNH